MLTAREKDVIMEEKETLIAAAEAILFAVGDSVSDKKLSDALGITKAQVKALMQELSESYEDSTRGICLKELDGSYQLCTKQEMYEYLTPIVQQQHSYQLTDTVLETLSIIAYRQPVTRVEIEKIRGVSSDHAVNRLMEFGLIREMGRLDAPGRPLLFGTTQEFLRCFGISSPDELPTLSQVQVDAFKKEAEEEIYAGDVDV